MNTPQQLSSLQADFTQAIFKKDRSAIARQVKTHGGLTAEQRVGIYRNSVHGILGDYLKSLYPVCTELLGDQFFSQFSDEYIDHSPPDSAFLSDYGGAMSALMREHEAFEELRWVADMADLEWARHLAWNAINQEPSDFSLLARFNEAEQSRICFQLPASAQLLTSEYAIHAIWMAHQPEDHPDKKPLEEIELHNNSHLIIWRAGRTLQQYILTETVWQFLQSVQMETPLDALTGQFNEQLPELLSGSIQAGWIISFTSPTSTS